MSTASHAELLASLRPIGVKRRFARSEFLFVSGEPVRGFFHVLSGEVRVFRMDDQGREVEVARLGPGDFLAEAVVFAADSYPAFARAVRDSDCLFFAKEKVMALLKKDPRTAMGLLLLLASKCLVLNSRVEALGLMTVRQRLAGFLLTRCSGSGPCDVDLRMKKSDLAGLLGTTSETLSRALRRMSGEGLVNVRGRTISVKDRLALRAELGR